ncbi:hypothetical protein D3C79_968370 [compost metagenome]
MVSYIPNGRSNPKPFECIGRLAKVECHLLGLLFGSSFGNPLPGQIRCQYDRAAVMYMHH